MPLKQLQFRPGVNREGTSLSNEGGWYECDKVRFRSGYPEKIGGWALWNGSFATFLGVCRSLWNWVTLKGFNIVGLGTSEKFYAANGGAYYDITPIRQTTTNTTTFSSTNGSNIITVTDTLVNNIQISDYVTFSGATAVGGLDLNKEFQIQTIITGTSYTIQTATNADNSGGNGGGSVTARYQLNSGGTSSDSGTGWSAGPWPDYNITTLTNPFATVNTSTTVTVNQTAHGLVAGKFVYFFSISDADINGIPSAVMVKAFEVITVVNANSYTISTIINGVSYPATSTGSGQGGTVLVYTPSGVVRNWGEAYTEGAVNFSTKIRLWSQANFGEFLLFNPRGGGIYIWQPGTINISPDYSVRGVLLSSTSTTPAGWASVVADTDCPTVVNQVLVADAARIVIAFGCNDYPIIDPTYTLDPLLVRWSAQESYTEWSPSATNQARSYRLSHGSAIIGALQTRQEIIVWTDASVYGMQYLGPPYVWGFTLLADNISIASPNAMATASGVTYWMGTDKFYVYSGRVETLPSALRSYVFDDINRSQFSQCFAGTNEAYSEIWWFYCSRNSQVIDRYVIFNYLDRVWYYGTMGRTAWLDSPVSEFPLAATYNNILVTHENAVDDGDVPNGEAPKPIYSYIQSSDFDIEDGHNYGFVWRMIPDITFDGSNAGTPFVTYSLRPRQNPGAPYNIAPRPTVTSNNGVYTNTIQTYNVQEFTEIVYTRVRGRQLAFKVESNTTGTQWQLGVPRIDVKPDGRRA